MATQVDETKLPFCPPNCSFVNKKYVVHEDVTTARNSLKKQLQHVSYRRKHRRYCDGALYLDLFMGFYDSVYSESGECVVNVLVEGVHGTRSRLSRIYWRRSTDVNNKNLRPLREWCVKNVTEEISNCRRITKDKGSMVVFGWRKFFHTPYKSNEKVSCLLETMLLATDHFRDLFPNVVNEISLQTLQTRIKIPGLENSAVAEMIVSKDLVNSSHIDYRDQSHSVTTWFESRPGNLQGKYFILPYTSKDGSRSIVFPIRDGQSIAWDGRIIHHCSSEGLVHNSNSVYGLFFGSK